MSFSKNILSFLQSLDLQIVLPENVEVMNPFNNEVIFNLCKQFYDKFYSDNNPRHFILGINPGRFGGGVTGIPFTDPIRLNDDCGIENNFQRRQELSSVFIYEMIKAFGGLKTFYGKFYISAISPLGFTKENKNMNFYDDKKLENSLKEFIIDCIEKQFAFGLNRDVAFCLGEGKNFKYLSALNDEMKFFERVVPLPHPRFIMQYKLKKKEEYIQRYLRELRIQIKI